MASSEMEVEDTTARASEESSDLSETVDDAASESSSSSSDCETFIPEEGTPEDIPLDSTSEADAIVSVLMEAAGTTLAKIRRQGQHNAPRSVLKYSEELETSDIVQTIDGMISEWRKDPSYNSEFLRAKEGAKPDRGYKARFAVGDLVWLKHHLHTWWPGVIKNVMNKKKGANTTNGIVSAMFIEPVYEYFLIYKKKGLQFTVNGGDILPFSPMPTNPLDRPEDQIQRSNEAWQSQVSRSYRDHTMFEVSERMAVVYAKKRTQMVVNNKLNMDFLGGLYWAADIIWRKMTGHPVRSLIRLSFPYDI